MPRCRSPAGSVRLHASRQAADETQNISEQGPDRACRPNQTAVNHITMAVPTNTGVCVARHRRRRLRIANAEPNRNRRAVEPFSRATADRDIANLGSFSACHTRDGHHNIGTAGPIQHARRRTASVVGVASRMSCSPLSGPFAEFGINLGRQIDDDDPIDAGGDRSAAKRSMPCYRSG